MFKALKNKLKGALNVFSKKVEEVAVEKAESALPEKQDLLEKAVPERKKSIQQPPQAESKEHSKKTQEKESQPEKKKPAQPAPEQSKEHSKKTQEKESQPEKKPQASSEKTMQELPEQEVPEKKDASKEPPVQKGFFSKLFRKSSAGDTQDTVEKKTIFRKIEERITTVAISEKKFEELFWDLEVVLLENNVALEVVEKIKADLKEELTSSRTIKKSIEQVISDTLKRSIQGLFVTAEFDIIKESKKKKPYVIAFIGVNGGGKTTTLAKVAKLLQDNGLSTVIAASDTFRAAAIQQLQEHAERLGVKLIKQDYNADPAAVAFDAIAHAKAKGIDVVLIDTAGRMHSDDNLMNELKKLIRVNQPDLKIFVGESITGNDCVEQCKLFDAAVGIDGIILSKADVDEKGGAAISVSFVTKKPIIFIGVGQEYSDLKRFDPALVIESLGL